MSFPTLPFKIQSPRDYETADLIVALGWPEIEPYLDRMAFLCLDGNYPVAQVFAPRLIGLGMRAVPAVHAVLEQFLSERNYCEVTNVLLLIVRHWDDSILREMQPLLSRIAAIDMTSDGEEGGIRAAELLQRLNQLRQPLPTTGLVLSDDLTSALDYETMSSVVWLGWPEIEKYLPTLVLYCTNETYGRGAAHAFAPRLIGLGAKAMPTICSVLYRCLNSQKYSEIDCLLRMVVRHWDNPILQPIQPFLKTITSPDVLPVGDNVRAQVVTLLERSHRSVI